MAEVNFNFDASAVIAKLEALKANIPIALEAAATYVLTAAQQRIISGQGDWPVWKRLPKRPHQMLWDTGTLLRSLTVGDSNNIFQVSDDTVVVGSNIRYAAAQNFGNNHLPPRPFFVFDSTNDEAAGRVFLRYLIGDANGS